MIRHERTAAITLIWLGWWGFWGATSPTNAQDPPAPSPPPATATPAAKPIDPTDPLVVAIVEAHNQLRAAENLPPLRFAPLLAQAAQIQASDMAEQNEMKHEGSDGSTPADRIKRVGYHPEMTGENVAVFYPDVPAVMQAWFKSPPHKKNILGDFTELGVARVNDKDGKPYWCVDFGKPLVQLDPTAASAAFYKDLNAARTVAKQPKLTVDPKLATAAQAQAVELAKAAGKEGTPSSFAGIDTARYAELAMTTATGPPTAEAALKLFLENPAYKERLLGSVTQMGIGYATDTQGAPYWCLILGKPVHP